MSILVVWAVFGRFQVVAGVPLQCAPSTLMSMGVMGVMSMPMGANLGTK